MIFTNVLLLFSLLFYGCAENAITEQPVYKPNNNETLDIITWNVQNFPKNNNITINYLSEIILEIDADIIALQEIESDQSFNQLLYKLGSWNGYRARSAYGGVNLAFLYKSNLQIMDINEIVSLDDYSLPRTPLMMELLWDNDKIFIINNHYKCCGDGEIDYSDQSDEEFRRLEGTTMLKSFVDTNLNDEKVIILGDLNDEIQEENNNVFQLFLNDENYIFADDEIANSSSSNWSWPGWNSNYSASHFDHIIINNNIYESFNNSHSVCETIMVENYLSGGWLEYYNNISDHRPVILQLKFEN